MPPALDPIETLCALDLGGRGINRLVLAGAMAAAARSLVRAQRVVLVTGFVARPGWAAETDGPSGTVVLGRALRRIGARVTYLAEPLAAPLLAACLRALGEPRDLVTVPAASAAALQAARETVSAFGPTHLIAIERPGRAVDGGYYNARGGSVAEVNALMPSSSGGGRERSRSASVTVGTGSAWAGCGRESCVTSRPAPRSPRWSGRTT